MSYFPSERSPRMTASWGFGTGDILRERRYKGGRPPRLNYFPSVSTLMNFALCPVAGVHEMFYGIDNALVPPAEIWGVGTLYEEFLAHLRATIAERGCPNSESQVERIFDDFTTEEAPTLREQCKTLVRKWLRKRFVNLGDLTGAKIYFGVHALGKVKIEGNEKTPYPLYGEIDEVDISNCRIIERTIKEPPELKDYQLWLYWKLLCNIPDRERPEIFQGIKFEDFDLIVETPNRDILVEKENPEYCKMAHDGFAWVHDLSSVEGSRVILEAYKEAEKFCSSSQPWNRCNLHHHICRIGSMTYPRARQSMHREIRKFYLSLLYEQMWTHHLFLYQLLQLSPQELEGWKLQSGELVSVDDRGIATIKIEQSPPHLLLESEEDEDIYEFDIIFGTPKLGLRRKGVKESIEGNTIKVKLKGSGPLPRDVHIISPRISIYREQPWFLYRLRQRGMRELERRLGCKRESTARKNLLVQFVEAAFGNKPLIGRRGG